MHLERKRAYHDYDYDSSKKEKVVGKKKEYRLKLEIMGFFLGGEKNKENRKGKRKGSWVWVGLVAM